MYTEQAYPPFLVLYVHMIDLDVLVVYSSHAALSASTTDSTSKHPFHLTSKSAGYNLPYAHFLQVCAKQGISAGFTTSTDIIGPGACSSFWTVREGEWGKVRQSACSTQIFDKISPTSTKVIAARKLLLSTKAINPFNDRELHGTFFDKLLTYKRLPAFSIPTVGIPSSTAIQIEKSLIKMQNLVQKHPYSGDFLPKFVLKDRFGAGGNHVYEIDANFIKKIHTIMVKNPTIQFVLQPFLAFDAGFSYKGKRSATDIRLIFHHNKILQSYLRLAKEDDFRCNEHQGGQLIYVTKRGIPDAIQTIAQKIVKKINKPDSLYALDFIVSNSGHVYFLEGNFGPGLDWDIRKKVNEKMSKQLIASIVDEFSLRIKRESNKRTMVL